MAVFVRMILTINNCQVFFVFLFFFFPFYLFFTYKNFPYAICLSRMVFLSFILEVCLLYLWQQSVLFCLYLFFRTESESLGHVWGEVQALQGDKIHD